MRPGAAFDKLHAGRVSLPATVKLPEVSLRPDLARHLAIFAVCAPGAAIVWYVFHGVYVSLSESVRAVGYVDASTQTGIYLGYVAMVAGTLVLAVFALRSGVCAAVILLQQRRGK